MVAVMAIPALAARRRERKTTRGRRAVNPRTKAPRAPGEWVDDRRCVCGARYSEYRSSIRRFVNALDAWLVESGDRGLYRERGHGVYVSRGPVLFFWRCLKLSEWYEEHYPCGCFGVTLDDLDDAGVAKVFDLEAWLNDDKIPF